MTTTHKDPVLVVLQMTGGNDYLNTVVPYGNGMYYDYRPTVGVPESDVIPIDSKVGLHPQLAAFKDVYDRGNLAIIHGVGYANSPRSHFRSMDIWHTCEPDTLGTEGWLGKVVRDIDPHKENVVTAVSMGPSMFRALSMPGVPVACVDNLDAYGLMTNVQEANQRARLLERYKRLYGPAVGTGPVMDFLGQTGLDALSGADILKAAPRRYESSVEYAETSIGRKLRSIAQIHLAELGTRIFYVDQGSYDSHSNQIGMHDKLLADMSRAVQDFFDDLRIHDAADNVVMLIFSEFGRRTYDNGSGTDHGAAGAVFALGDAVRGGQYSEYPSIARDDLEQGDPVPNLDFRGVYTTLIEEWLALDPTPIVGGTFEKPRFLN